MKSFMLSFLQSLALISAVFLAANDLVVSAFGMSNTLASGSSLLRSRGRVLSMALNANLADCFPRDFKNIPHGTDYGEGDDSTHNRAVESRRLQFLEDELYSTLKTAVTARERPMLTTALIAGDNVILDALAKTDLLQKVPIVFVDTFTLFPETLEHLKEVEAHYGFKSQVYHAADCKDVKDYHAKYGSDYWIKDIEKYDMLCKVEPMNRALKEQNSDCWINGRRRDHGAERAALPVWEGKKLNPLAFWTFEDCWSYLRKHNVPYHPLHDSGYPSLGDMHSTEKVDVKKWFAYGGERSGRFQNLLNKDGTVKTECGIHSKISNSDLNIKSDAVEEEKDA